MNDEVNDEYEEVVDESEELEESTEEAEESAAPTDEEQEQEDAPAKPKRNRVQERINELVKEREDWKRQAQFFAEQARERESTKQAEPPPVDKVPEVDDYERYEDYIDALTDYKTAKAIESRIAATREQQKAAQAKAVETERITAMQAKIMEGRSKYNDFDAVALGNHIPVTDEMAAVIADSEYGADIAYYLGNNPDEAMKIAKLTPIGTVRALGRLEAKLEQGNKLEKSKAPAPINPVKKGAKPVVDPSSMSIDEWMKWRQKQIA